MCAGSYPVYYTMWNSDICDTELSTAATATRRRVEFRRDSLFLVTHTRVRWRALFQ